MDGMRAVRGEVSVIGGCGCGGGGRGVGGWGGPGGGGWVWRDCARHSGGRLRVAAVPVAFRRGL